MPDEPERKRYLRNPKVVFIVKIDDDHFLVKDEDHEYTINQELLKKDYEEI